MPTRGSLYTFFSSESSLANNANSAASAAYDNNGPTIHLLGDFELAVTFGTAPTAGNLVELYLLSALDDTNYADGGGSVTPPPSAFKGAFPVRNVTTAQRLPCDRVEVPPHLFKAVLRNAAGQTINANYTLTMVPYTP